MSQAQVTHEWLDSFTPLTRGMDLLKFGIHINLCGVYLLFLVVFLSTKIRKMDTNLTSSLVGDMGKESNDLTLRILLRTHPPELRKRTDRRQKPLSGVELLPFTTGCSLIDYPIEKLLRHNICNRHVVRNAAAAVLTHHPSGQCSGQNSGEKDSQ